MLNRLVFAFVLGCKHILSEKGVICSSGVVVCLPYIR